LRGVQPEIRIAQKLARQQHQIGAADGYISSACWGMVINPTAAVSVPVWRRMRSANRTW
jgi:hypothetical protein